MTTMVDGRHDIWIANVHAAIRFYNRIRHRYDP